MSNLREEIEAKQRKILSPWAIHAEGAGNREEPEEPDPIRTAFMRDRDRIIHSKSFRRLKHKTQVYISPNNDHYRTRLTHTLEVAQVSRTIGRALGLNEDLIEAMALAHDVGHTPFAHTGEEVLNNLLPGGFKHEENSVRVLTRIEEGSRGRGLNLTREVLDGVRNHGGLDDSPSRPLTLEGQVIQLSDKIAYVQHDIDDSLRAGVILEEDLPKEYIEVLGMTHGERIATLVTDVVLRTRQLMKEGQRVSVSFSDEVRKALRGLREFLFHEVYESRVCRAERERAIFVLEAVYHYYRRNLDKLPPFYRRIAEEEGPERGIADYLSGMSDSFCLRVFEELFLPRSLIQGFGDEKGSPS